MAADIGQRSHVGFRAPASFHVQKDCQSSIPFGQSNDPSQYFNQLQFNINTPYSINSLASNFKKPQPLVIEKLPIPLTTAHPVIPRVHAVSLSSSPASSISSNRLHFAVQLAKLDAKKMKEDREMEQYNQQKQRDTRLDVSQNRKGTKPAVVHAVRKAQDVRKKHDNLYKTPQKKLQNRYVTGRKDKRTLHEFHFYPEASEGSTAVPAHTSDDKQTREIRRLERQMQKYLEKLDDLIHKGQEVIQKKDKRLKRQHKDDNSHLSDDDTDPRQFERAEEQATRSARVLYMIERQIRELDDELCKKGKNMRQPKKSQTLSRLAAAQRATVRALQMLINSAPLQPKGSQHYPSIYRDITSLIQQLSLLSMQLKSGELPNSPSRKPQNTECDDFLKTRGYQKQRKGFKEKSRSLKEETELNKPAAFFTLQEPAADDATALHCSSRNTSDVKEMRSVDDSVLTIEPTPERSATLKAGLEALLRTKELEKRPTNTIAPANTKKKAVLLPPLLQAKRKRAQLAVQKSLKLPDEAAHFTKETTASRLKKVERPKTSITEGMRENEKSCATAVDDATKSAAPSPRNVSRNLVGLGETLQEKEIKRQVWLEDEAKRKLREVMEIPKHLVSEAEEAIKMKLKPILEQAQAVVDSSKMKPIQERFAALASNVTMKESETLSEMILDDVLIDTVEEFQRLENDGVTETQESYFQDSSTLENILQRLEEFEKEEESVRRRLMNLSYTDVNETRPSLRRNEQHKSPESINTYFETGTREPCPIVIESKNTVAEKDKTRKLLSRFAKDRSETFTSEEQDGATNMASKSVNYTRTSTLTGSLENPPFPVFLPSKVRENIFSYREKYERYLKETNTQHHGTFDPWRVVEKLSDEIFDEILDEVAVEFGGACDNVTELIFKSEFMKD